MFRVIVSEAIYIDLMLVFLVEFSLSQRILGYLAVKKVASYRELRDCLHEDKKKVSGTLFYLCKVRKLKRLPFSTKWGKVVYRSNVPIQAVWDYCFENDLVPPTTKMFFSLLSKQRCVSTLELYDMGIDITDVRFFIDTFTKRWKLVKISQVGQWNIFYHDEEDLKKYISVNQSKLENIQSKEQTRRQEEGRVFEDIIEKFYQLKGFTTTRNRWFMTEDQERIEVDILAEKHFFDFENDRSILIAVECKSWKNGEHFYTLTEFLNHYCKLKSILPSAQFHVWAYNYSRVLLTYRLI